MKLKQILDGGNTAHLFDLGRVQNMPPPLSLGALRALCRGLAWNLCANTSCRASQCTSLTLGLCQQMVELCAQLLFAFNLALLRLLERESPCLLLLQLLNLP